MLLGNGITDFNVRSFLRRRLPIIAWLPLYTWDKLLQDILAGLTVGLTVIPQGIAYALVGGLPTQYGLYSSFMGCFVYLLFGSTNEVTVGPTALMGLLSQPYVLKLGENIAVLLCFLSGCVITGMGLLHLDFLLDFISMPVICGFTNAAAIIIATSQVGTLLGIAGRSESFMDSINKLVKHINEISLWDTVLGCFSIIALLCLKRLPGRKDGAMYEKFFWLICLARNAVVVIMGIILSYVLSLYEIRPFKITGYIPEGLPPIGPPPFALTHANRTYDFLDLVGELKSSIFWIPAIALLETIAIAKAFAKDKTVDVNQEMLAVGLCNVFASFVRSMPITGSFTRTAVNSASGVKTPMGGVITGGLVLLACGLLTKTFALIPKTTLAAVIIIAMYFMLEVDIFVVLWKTNKIDLIPLTVTLLLCLTIGLEYGMIVGTAIHLMLLLYFVARPGLLIEERKINGHKILFVCPKQSLNFPGAEHLRKQVLAWCDLKREFIPIVMEGRHVHKIDTTATKNLVQLQNDLEVRNQKFVLWNWCEEAKKTIISYESSLERYFRNSGCLKEIFPAMEESVLQIQ